MSRSKKTKLIRRKRSRSRSEPVDRKTDQLLRPMFYARRRFLEGDIVRRGPSYFVVEFCNVERDNKECSTYAAAYEALKGSN